MSETTQRTLEKDRSGGRKIILGKQTFDVLSGYSPAWTKEYGDSFTTWDGRIIKKCKGIRFSLDFSTYGLSESEVSDLKTILMSDSISLECDDFKGNVSCEGFSAKLKSSNFYGDFSNADIRLTATELTAAADDGDGGL